MKNDKKIDFSKRERQIMDIIYSRNQLNAREIQSQLSDTLSYSTVRTLLRILINKGFLKTKKQGLRYIYYPVIPIKEVRNLILKNLITTYFNNSIEETITSIIEIYSNNLSKTELIKLSELIKNRNS
jgi:predicted transcriptional regulator